jgi:hypothetical protein
LTNTVERDEFLSEVRHAMKARAQSRDREPKRLGLSSINRVNRVVHGAACVFTPPTLWQLS